MSEQKIQPHNVTKPIQLLAAWLVGLILINGSFLGAAKVISSPDWAAGSLVIAAIVNVPLFLVLIFFLQTKFRAELQEDTYYSKHLDKITGEKKETISKNDEIINHLKEIQKVSDGKIDVISKNLEDVTKSLSEFNISSFDAGTAIEKIQETKKSIVEMEENKARRRVKIAINKEIPSYLKISKVLVSFGFNINLVFGQKEPSNLTISYFSNMPKELLSELYVLLEPYGFNRLDYGATRDSSDKSDVYIGSYVDDFAEASIAIKGEVRAALLDSSVSFEDFNKLVILSRA